MTSYANPYFSPDASTISGSNSLNSGTSSSGSSVGPQGPPGPQGPQGVPGQSSTGGFTGSVTGANILSLTGTSLNYVTATCGTGLFTSLSSASGTFVSLTSGSGSFISLSATGASLPSVTGTYLAYALGSFSQLSATGAGIGALTGGSLTYASAGVGTGTFGSLSAGSGSFTQLSATGSSLSAVTGSSLAYVNAAIGTGSFSQLSSTGGSIASLSGTSHSAISLFAATGTMSALNLLNSNGSYVQLTGDANGGAVIGGGLTLNAPLTGTSAVFSTQVKAQFITVSSSLNSLGSNNFQTFAATGASVLSLSGTSLNYITAVMGTGTFFSLNSASGTFTQLVSAQAGIPTLTGTSLNYVTTVGGTGSYISLSSASGSFTQLNATGAGVTTLTGTALNYGTVIGGSGSFTSVFSTSGTFTQLNSAQAGISTLTGTSLSYVTTVGGTGSYISLSSASGSFTQLNASGGSIASLSGTSLNYVTVVATGASIANATGSSLSYSLISASSGSFVGLSAVSGTFTQLSSTGAFLFSVTGNSLGYSTISSASGSFAALSASSGTFNQLNGTGAFVASISGSSLSYATVNAGSITSTTGGFVSLRAGTGSFGSLISGTGAFTSSLSVGGTLTTQRNVLDDGQGNASFTGASLMVGSTGIATTNAAILAQNSSWQLRSTGGIAAPPSGGNLFSVVSLNTGTSQLTLTQLGAVRTSNNTLDDGGGGVLINGGSFAVKNPGGTSLMVLNSNNLLSQNSILDDGMGRLSALGCIASRGPLTSTIASSSAQMGVQSGGLSNSIGAFVQGYASSAASALPLNLNAAGGAVYTQRNIVDDGISGNALVNGRLQFSNGATATNITGDSYGGLSVTNLASTGTSLSIVPSVPQTGFYFADTNAGDSAVRYSGMTGGLIRLGTVSTASSLRIGGTTVRTLNNVMDDGSGNVTVSATGTLNALTLNLSQSSGNCNGWGVYNPTLPVNSTLYNYVGLTGSGNNAGYLAFQYIGAGSTSNSIGLGFQGNGNAVLRLRANSSASTQFNVLDDGSGNLVAAGSVSSSYYASANTPHFHFQSLAAAGSNPGGNYGILLDSTSAMGLNAGGGGVYTMNGGARRNTLDDGSGNMLVSGTGTFAALQVNGNVVASATGTFSQLQTRGNLVLGTATIPASSNAITLGLPVTSGTLALTDNYIAFGTAGIGVSGGALTFGASLGSQNVSYSTSSISLPPGLHSVLVSLYGSVTGTGIAQLTLASTNNATVGGTTAVVQNASGTTTPLSLCMSAVVLVPAGGCNISFTLSTMTVLNSASLVIRQVV